MRTQEIRMDNERLKNLSVGQEQMPVRTPVGTQERREIDNRFTELAIKIAGFQDKLDLARFEFKTAAKPLQEEMTEILNILRAGYKESKKMCFLVPDYEAGEMQYMDPDTGEVVFTRRLRPEERQMSILQLTGTDNKRGEAVQ
jgi:hypothetical protein